MLPCSPFLCFGGTGGPDLFASSSPWSAVSRLHSPSTHLNFCNKQLVSCFFSSAYIWVLFPIFLPVLLQCRWKGWKVVWPSRLCRAVNTSVGWWKQWLNLSDHVVVVICLARGAIGNFLGVRWWNVCFLLVFGKPKHWPSSASSELAKFRLLNCQGQIAVAPWLTLSPHLNLVLMLYFL